MSANNSTTEDDHTQLASSFHHDGYISLSDLFSPAFTSQLFDECISTFHALLNYLCRHGETEFAAPSRLSSTSDGSIYQYPLAKGLKNGYKELVMRSQGRYEMALLVHDTDGKEKVMSADLLRDGNARSSNCLELLIEWIQTGIKNGSFEPNQSEDAKQEAFTQDHRQLQKLLDLVNTIFSEPDSSGDTNNNYHLVNFSLVISTPGSETQSWHADGGHVSLTSHAPCHVFNVFVPLVDVPLSMGPTELRPGSHYYTRDLAKMMLGAMARKELRPTVTPKLKKGDALLFDYRILHRGKANVSHLRDEVGQNHKEENMGIMEDRTHGGRDRPILVMTFAKNWFVDVCNFPKRSIFEIAKA